MCIFFVPSVIKISNHRGRRKNRGEFQLLSSHDLKYHKDLLDFHVFEILQTRKIRSVANKHFGYPKLIADLQPDYVNA